MVRWQGVCVGLLGLLCGAWMQGQAKTDAAQASDAVLPLSVELLAPLSAKSTHAGAPVLGKVTQGWVGPGCTLARGGTVGGHVVDVHLEPQAKVTRLALIFDRADCGGKAPLPYPFRLFAVIAPPEQPYQRNPSENDGLFSGVDHVEASAAPERHMATVSEIMNEAPKGTDGGAAQAPKVLTLNGVYGLGSMTLQQDAGLVASLTTQQKNLRLGLRTTLILISGVEPTKEQVTAASTPAARAPAPTVAAVKPPAAVVEQRRSARAAEEPIACAAGCTVALAGTAPEADSARSGVPAEAKLDLAKLGYGRADRRELMAFHHLYALTFLGADRLLVTFDLHRMRLRVTDGMHAEYAHTVRAVLMDVRQKQVLQTLDWQVRGEDQYVWPVGQDHVLVHVGTELRLLDADLATQHTFQLPSGVLQWAGVSPLGKLIAVGVLEEQHSPETHARLKSLSVMEPEEKTRVTLLDGELRPLRTAMQSSSAEPLRLLDGGELQVRNESGGHWRLEEALFAGGVRSIMKLRSDCEPVVSIPEQALIFVTGCSVHGNWYGMVRPDGGTVLRGTTSWQQIEEAAEGAAGEFIVRVVRTAATTTRQSRLRADGMAGEELGVYRSSDGRRVRTVELHDVPLTEQSFALSPDGRTVAALDAHAVLLFEVGTSR